MSVLTQHLRSRGFGSRRRAGPELVAAMARAEVHGLAVVEGRHRLAPVHSHATHRIDGPTADRDREEDGEDDQPERVQRGLVVELDRPENVLRGGPLAGYQA